MFTYKTVVKLHDTDAAGLLFFSNQFKMVHEAYEAFFELIGFSFAKLIRDCPFFLPIVHAQADYKSPLFVGDELEITVTVEKIGNTSFTLVYQILDHNKNIVGTAKTVHVSIDKKVHAKIPLPQDLRGALKKSL